MTFGPISHWPRSQLGCGEGGGPSPQPSCKHKGCFTSTTSKSWVLRIRHLQVLGPMQSPGPRSSGPRSLGSHTIVMNIVPIACPVVHASLSPATTKEYWHQRAQGANAAWYRAKAKLQRDKLKRKLDEKHLKAIKDSQKENFNSGIICK